MNPVTVKAATDRGYHLARAYDGRWFALGPGLHRGFRSLPLAFRYLRLCAETVELRAPDMLRLQRVAPTSGY